MPIATRGALVVFAGLCGAMDGASAQEAEDRRKRAASTPAQSAAASDPPVVELPPVNVEGSLPDHIDETPGAAARLSAEQIDALRPYTLHDALDFIPGLRHIDDDALGRRSSIGVRGAPSRRSRKTLLLEDGVPINASAYLDPSAHYTPPVERLQSIDVLKGAGHVLHGPLNNHGIVNFINQRPTLAPQTTIEAAGGNLGSFKRHLMHSRTDGALGTVFSYTGMNADGVFDVEDTQFDDFYARADWALSSRQTLGFSATYLRERSHYDESNLTPIEFDLAPRRKRDRFGQQYNTMAVDYQKYTLTHDFQISDRLSMSTSLFATDIDRPRFTVDPDEIELDALPDFVYDDPAREFVRGQSGVMISRDRQYNTYGIDSRMQLSDLWAFGTRHDLQWGIRFERHFLDNAESFGDVGEVLSVNNRGHYFGENEFEEAMLETYQASAVSGFFQDTMRFGKLSITPGIRVEHYTQSKEIKFEASTFINEREADDHTLVLPSIAALYDVDERTQLYGNIARGYTPAFARTAEEFPLKPETGINSQIGFRTAPTRSLRIDGAVFYNLIRDTVVQEPYTIDGENLVVNAEDSIAYGIDLGIRLGLSPADTRSGLAPFAELAYNYTRAEFTAGELDGHRVPEVPLNAGSLTLGVAHRSGWEISATASHFGSFFTDLANTRERRLADEDGVPLQAGDRIEIREPAVLGEVASHTIFSARASYSFGNKPRTTLWLQGRNLSDKLYVTDHVNGLRPGAERSVMAGATLRF